MRKFILATAALASLAAPLAAQADPGDDRRDDRGRQEQRNDARDHHDDRRDDHRGDRGGDHRDDRRDDHRGDRGGDRRDDRRGDWHEARGYGGPGGWHGERRYDAGRFEYPRGYSYRAWGVGGFLPRSYWGERYWVARPVAYGLPYAGPGTRWIRVGPDALLIRNFNGAVIRVARGIFY